MKVTEKQLQDAVLEHARLAGWLVYHTFDSRRSTHGFPDLVLVRPPRLIFVELKTETGKASDAQTLWLDRLAGCDDACEVYLWRPSDLDKTIPDTLKKEQHG